MLAGIEAGGTKFVCGVGSGPDDLKTAQFPTSAPELTLPNVIQFFKEEAGGKISRRWALALSGRSIWIRHRRRTAISRPRRNLVGPISICGRVRRALGVPVGFDTDVNGAVLGEARWGAARGLSDAVYLTIGTGIGGGAIVHGRGRAWHGASRRSGICAFRMISARSVSGCVSFTTAIVWKGWLRAGHAGEMGSAGRGLYRPTTQRGRWKRITWRWPWLNLTVTLSTQRFLLGGGVMQQPHLVSDDPRRIRALAERVRAGTQRILTGLDDYIGPPQLGSQAGILGALVLAEKRSQCS